jgi:hypothetical protein
MSEKIHTIDYEVFNKGPLDLVREIGTEAAELDQHLSVVSEDEITPQLQERLTDEINELSDEHPLFGEEVRVYGQAVTTSINGEGDGYPLALMPADSRTSVTGRYEGLSATLAYNPDTDEIEPRIVHMIHTGTVVYPNMYNNRITEDFMAQVCADGATVEPIVPLNAHSLLDLSRDRVVKGIDKILIEDLTPGQRLAKVAKYANRVLRQSTFASTGRYNHQRVSYLNSLNILQEVLVAGKEFAISDSRSDFIEGEDVSYYEANEEPQFFEPEALDLLHGYCDQPDGSVASTGLPELYFIASTMDDKEVFVPVKHAVEYRDYE